MQYACEDTLDPAQEFRGGAKANTANNPRPDTQHIGAPRDGTPRDENDAATDTIPTARENGIANTVETRRFGMNENPDYYQACTERERNLGLFTADQNVRRRDARGTRQNPNGNRNGLECPEERDYWPYWAPNPWIDVAVLHDYGDGDATEQANWCAWFQANSQNSATNQVGECQEDPAAQVANGQQTPAQLKQRGEWHNNQAACTAAGHNWVVKRFGLSNQAAIANLGLTDVDCLPLASSRINQLGNAEDSTFGTAAKAAAGDIEDLIPHRNNANRYVWRIPDHADKNCVLRVRYNITTGDYPPMIKPAGTTNVVPGVDFRNNSDSSPVQQDPYIVVNTAGDRQDIVSLALNTNQYGRTFQDRSYVFEIRKPLGATETPADPSDSAAQIAADRNAKVALDAGRNIFNVNVRGKRGNIVQTYPAVEYDYVPNDLNVWSEDVVHFQWTGSDYNPRRGCNDAEGGPPDPNNAGAANQNSRADRSNIISLGFDDQNMPLPLEKTNPLNTMFVKMVNGQPTVDQEMEFKLAYLNQNEDLAARNSAGCLTQAELENINNKNERENHPRNCAKLNAAFTPYFDAGPVTMQSVGRWPFFSSRNNNFSNRDQTGVICVDDRARSVAGMPHMCKDPVNALVTAGSGAGTGTGAAPTIPSDSVVIQLPVDAVDAGAPTLEAGTDVVTSGPNENDAEGDGDMFPCEETTFSLGTVKTELAIGLAVGMLFVGAFILFVVQFACSRMAARKSGRETVGFLDFMVNAVSWKGYAMMNDGKPSNPKPKKAAGRAQRTPSRSAGVELAAPTVAATSPAPASNASVTRPPNASRPPVRNPRTVPPPPSG